MIRVDLRKMVEEIVWEFSMAVGKSKQIIDEAIKKSQNCSKCENKPTCTESKEEVASHSERVSEIERKIESLKNELIFHQDAIEKLVDRCEISFVKKDSYKNFNLNK